nr:metal tolerance protein B [Ipomoea batatas]GMD73339.1 metal tolerance protein B [Ipomoea batatas]
MEQQGDSGLIQQKQEAELYGIPKPLQFSCSPICLFSQQEYNTLDSRNRSKSATKLCGLIIFYAAVMVVEIIGGVEANSLAVLTDAGHLLTDIAGFSISLFTVWVSGWEVTPEHSYGFHRLEVLGALVSVQLIWFISGILIYQALGKIFHDNVKVNGMLMFATAAFGFVINCITVLWLGHDHSHSCHSHHSHTSGDDHSHSCRSRHSHTSEDHHNHELEELCPGNGEESKIMMPGSPGQTEILNINIEGAYLHVIVDLIQSVGVMIAGAIMWAKPEWFLVDLLCTLIFSTVALSTTIPMLRNIFSILMEGTPQEVDIPQLKNGLKCIEGVHDVHDLHVWSITVGKTVLACHVVTEPGANPNEVLHRVREYCERKFKIHHVTIQIEQES